MVEYNPNRINEQTIAEKITKLGYPATIITAEGAKTLNQQEEAIAENLNKLCECCPVIL